MPHAIVPVPRVLFIDAYDSFSNNIISLVQSALNVKVTVIRIDERLEDLALFLRPFAAVIAGPGPGHPKNLADVGLFNDLWTLDNQNLLPILGICLGFQSLVLSFGGKVEALPHPRHGIARKIRSNNQSIFKDITDIISVQYHSLHATIGGLSAKDMFRTENLANFLDGKTEVSQLQPLAWDLETDNQFTNNSGAQSLNPAAILMAVAHKTKPFFGIQFHPESICSNSSAQKILNTWWESVQDWNRVHRDTSFQRVQITPLDDLSVCHNVFLLEHKVSYDVGSPNGYNAVKSCLKSTIRHPDRLLTAHLKINGNATNQDVSDEMISPPSNSIKPVKYKLLSQSFSSASLTVPGVCAALRLQKAEVILLESELHQRPEVGTHSIIGIITPKSLKLEYNVGASIVRHVQGGVATSVSLQRFDGNIFSYLKHYMKHHKAEEGESGVPFWGGLMGYITYEACLETINIRSDTDQNSRMVDCQQNPDLSFVFVERSIVFDHQQQRLYVQSIRPYDNDWVHKVASHLNQRIAFSKDVSYLTGSFPAKTSEPDEYNYKSKIRGCQRSIRKGDAYELCLTTQSKVMTVSSLPAWRLYLRLRMHNPAPFSAYVRLGHLTLLSSSPERFLRWSRPAMEAKIATSVTRTLAPLKTITCQFRPIKGTVNRTPKDPTSLPVTLAQATAILSTPKERAENLMIVDLIRHDLHGVVGSGNVHVRKLMVVEEYATLYQLVTVIEGTLRVRDSEDDKITRDVDDSWEYANEASTGSATTNHNSDYQGVVKTGIDVLAASLPPGSMTGAPKRRACQLLRALEDRPRGIYSGVLGYLDVGGGGDFSVVIRSAVRWDSAKADLDLGDPEPDEEWRQSRNEHDNEAGHGSHESGNGSGTNTETNATFGDTWHVGAGGAVTTLSTEDGEWEEMIAKMKSTMGIFDSRLDAHE